MLGLTIVELDGVSGSITLDGPLMETYSGITSMNNNMSGDFPMLAPGMNAVIWSGKIKARCGPTGACFLLQTAPTVRAFESLLPL